MNSALLQSASTKLVAARTRGSLDRRGVTLSDEEALALLDALPAQPESEPANGQLPQKVRELLQTLQERAQQAEGRALQCRRDSDLELAGWYDGVARGLRDAIEDVIRAES